MADVALAIAGLAITLPALAESMVKAINIVQETVERYKHIDSAEADILLKFRSRLYEVTTISAFMFSEAATDTTAVTTVDKRRTAQRTIAPATTPAASLDPMARDLLEQIMAKLETLLAKFVKSAMAQELGSGKATKSKYRRLLFAIRGRHNPIHRTLQELDDWRGSFLLVVCSATVGAGFTVPPALHGLMGYGLARPQGQEQTQAKSLHQQPQPQQLPQPQHPQDSMAALGEMLQTCFRNMMPGSLDVPLLLEPHPRDVCEKIPYSRLLYHDAHDPNLVQVYTGGIVPQAMVVKASSSSSSCEESYFLESHTAYLPGESSSQAAAVRGIASFLYGANPALVALLPCKGFFLETEKTTHYYTSAPETRTLVFRVPPGLASPQSLRSILLQDTERHVRRPRRERLAIMKKLVSAVLLIHTAQHIHKSIRADNVILMKEKHEDQQKSTHKSSFPPSPTSRSPWHFSPSSRTTSGSSASSPFSPSPPSTVRTMQTDASSPCSYHDPMDLDPVQPTTPPTDLDNDDDEDELALHHQSSSPVHPFLVGFSLARHDSGESQRESTAALHERYYLHPERQHAPTRRYSMKDDVYSLGVLLLEIALWRSLVRFEPDVEEEEEVVEEQNTVDSAEADELWFRDNFTSVFASQGSAGLFSQNNSLFPQNNSLFPQDNSLFPQDNSTSLFSQNNTTSLFAEQNKSAYPFTNQSTNTQRQSLFGIFPKNLSPDHVQDPIPGTWMPTSVLTDRSGRVCNAHGMQESLVGLARTEVAQTMGPEIAGLIEWCLTGLWQDQQQQHQQQHQHQQHQQTAVTRTGRRLPTSAVDQKGRITRDRYRRSHGSNSHNAVVPVPSAGWDAAFQRGLNLADRDGIVVGQAYIRHVVMVMNSLAED